MIIGSSLLCCFTDKNRLTQRAATVLKVKAVAAFYLGEMLLQQEKKIEKVAGPSS